MKVKFTVSWNCGSLKKGAFGYVERLYTNRNYAEVEMWYERGFSTPYYANIIQESKGAFTFAKKLWKCQAHCQNHAIFGIQKAPFFHIEFWDLKGAKNVIYRFSAFRRYFYGKFGIVLREINVSKNARKYLKKLKKIHFCLIFWNFEILIKMFQKLKKNVRF